MSDQHNYALYYPTIEFQNYAWLWSAALLWDRIYRIVPESYQCEDVENVRVLVEEGEIGIPIHPDRYAKDIADEFLNKLQSESWDAAALSRDVPETYATLHEDKVDVKIRKLIIAQGAAAKHSNWLYVPTSFEALYMTYLAKHVAEANGLQLVSDVAGAWSGETYFRFDGHIEGFPRDDLAQQLAALVIRDFVPANILQIRPKELIKFREKYRDERIRFLTAIKNAAKLLSDCSDPSVVRDHVEDIKKDVESALSDYKKSMSVLKVTAWTGIKSLSFPVITDVVAKLVGKSLDPTTLVIMSGLNLAIGVVSGLGHHGENRKRLSRECDYSYLLRLERNWKGCYRDCDYNYYLCRQMEEFIND